MSGIDDEEKEKALTLLPLLRGNTDIFDIVIAIHKAKSLAIQELLCNKLYDYNLEDIEFFVPQLCNMVIYSNKTVSETPLEKFLLDICRSSLHLGTRIYLSFYSAAQDNQPDTVDRCKKLADAAKWMTIYSSKDSDMGLTLQQFVALRNMVEMPPTPSVTSDPLASPNTQANSDESFNAYAEKYRQLINNFADSHRSVPMLDGLPNKQFLLSSEECGPDISAFVLFNDISTRGLDIALSKPVSSTKLDDFLRLSEQAQRVIDKASTMSVQSPSDERNLLWKEVRALDDAREQLRRIVGSFDTRPSSTVSAGHDTLVHSSKLEAELNSRKIRYEFFFAELNFLSVLTGISSLLKSLNLKTKEAKNTALRACLKELNSEFQRGVYHKHSGRRYRIIRIPYSEAFTLNSKEKVPYMVYFEVVAESDCEEQTPVAIPTSSTQIVHITDAEQSEGPSSNDAQEEACKRKEITDEWVYMDESEQETVLDKVFGEPWAKKRERIRRTSPLGGLKNWDLLSMIIKSGDDLRQEQLATQLIRVFHSIFTSENLPLWVKPYEVLAISAQGGYIETVHDAISLHSLKQELGPDISLRSYFIKAYGDITSSKFIEAQRNFAESLAAYSLICYILQIKDRHNGNILIDREGHIIHIDYGFMLSSSPGSLNFETAPFKLTIEFVEVMGGRQSQIFNYFNTLISSGFLALRKHAYKIISLVEMLLPGSTMACFAKGPNTVKELEDRFQLGLTDAQAIEFASQLVQQSLGHWRTESYDTYQRYFSGIYT